MTFLVGRMQVRVSPSVLPAIAFSIVFGEWKRLLLATMSLAVHETAHAIAARNAGFGIVQLSVWPFGAVMQLDEPRGGAWTVAAAGPLASLTVSGMLRLASAAFGRSEAVDTLVYTNLAIAILNLLPAFPLDGGRVLKAILLKTLHERAARTVLLILTGTIAAALFCIGVYLICIGTPAWTLPALSPFLLASAIREWREPDAGTVSRVMERREAIRKGQAQRTAIVAVSEQTTVREAMALLSARRFTILRVQGERRVRELDESALLDAAAKFGLQTPLKTVIFRLTERD